MRVNEKVCCETFPCVDVRPEAYIIPDININPENVCMIMISEATPADQKDDYYAGGNSLFEQTTVLAFNDAGLLVRSIKDILKFGVYLTSAVKCGKIGYGIKAATIKECSLILEKEIALLPNLKVFMMMGDVAIKSINYIAKRNGEGRVIPTGSTYKLRGGEYYFRGKRAFPSYLQAGPSFFIEKSKRRMIAEDIEAAFKLL